jgi:hypothetical protein
MGGEAPHIFEGLPGPPGAGQTSNVQPQQIPAREPSGTQIGLPLNRWTQAGPASQGDHPRKKEAGRPRSEASSSVLELVDASSPRLASLGRPQGR